MVKLSVIFVLLLMFILTPFASSANDFAYNRLYDGTQPIDGFNYSINTNSSDFWVTDLGSLGTVNPIQFNNIAGTLTIDEAHLGLLFCELTGCTMSGDITFNNAAIQNPNYIQFNTTYTDGTNEGRLQWSIEDGTLEFGMPGGNVNQQIGLENLRRVKANETISNGDVIYPCGGIANRLIICKADYGSIATAGAFGIATEDIVINQFGYVNAFGYVRDINTTGALGSCSDGSPAWLSNNGGFQCIPPTGDKIKTLVGVIVSAHETNGIIDIEMQVVPRLQGLSQVNGTGLGSEHIFIYNATSSIWENRFRPNWVNISKNSFIDGSVFGLMMTNPPNIELPHLYIQSGGAGQFSGMVRSWGVVNEEPLFLDSSDRTDCQAYFDFVGEELKIDCNTSTSGADFFVSDDFQVIGDSWFKDTDGEWHFMTRELELMDENRENTVLSRLNSSIINGNNLTIIESHGKNIVVTLHEHTEILNRTSDSILLTEGTNSTPSFNHIYYSNGASTTLGKSTSQVNNVGDVAFVLMGDGFDYGSISDSANQYEFTRKNYFDSWYRGEVYQSGFDINVTSTEINISTGEMWLLMVTKTITENHSTNDLAIEIHSDGTFHQHLNAFDDFDEYGTGELISNNKYFNLVCGISNTLEKDGRMYCMVQDKPATEHTKLIDAETDTQYVNYFPSDTFIKKLFTPIVQVVVQRTGGTNTIKELTTYSGNYIDLRGRNLGTGGSPPTPGITSLSQLEIDVNLNMSNTITGLPQNITDIERTCYNSDCSSYIYHNGTGLILKG